MLGPSWVRTTPPSKTPEINCVDRFKILQTPGVNYVDHFKIGKSLKSNC